MSTQDAGEGLGLASASKFSVSGEPNAVILPLFVKADDGLTRVEMPIPSSVNPIVANKVRRDRHPYRGTNLCIGFPLVLLTKGRSDFVVSNSAGGNAV